MNKNKSKDNCMRIPIEKHDTAAWANIESSEPVSNVPKPSETDVINAKEWVDTNEK